MDRLPFVDLPDPVVPSDDSLDLSPYTAPTWARSTPRHRPASVSWPPAEPALPADRLLDELVAELVVDERITKAVDAWLDRAERRIADAVRPHLGDVHVARCGSFASRTHLSAAWDVDIAVRTLAEPPTARRSGSSDPVNDLARWLTTDLEVPASVNANSVAVDAPGGVVVRVLPFWHVNGRRADDAGPSRCPVDPVAHTQLVCARNAHLGNNGCFSRLIRVIKHLTRRHEPAQEPALSSFAVETLALNVSTTPFCLAEGVTHFLRTCAELVNHPFTHPLAPDAPITLLDARRVADRLGHAADICEGALFSVEPAGLRDLSRLLEAQGDWTARPPSMRPLDSSRTCLS